MIITLTEYSKRLLENYHLNRPIYAISNGINILGLYLKSYKNHEKVTVKKEELNFDIFNPSSSNVPMLYSEDNFTRLALRGLAC